MVAVRERRIEREGRPGPRISMGGALAISASGLEPAAGRQADAVRRGWRSRWSSRAQRMSSGSPPPTRRLDGVVKPPDGWSCARRLGQYRRASAAWADHADSLGLPLGPST
ncbi:hypothetical protein ACRAWD_03895 [Caulobacter segnis]